MEKQQPIKTPLGVVMTVTRNVELADALLAKLELHMRQNQIQAIVVTPHGLKFSELLPPDKV